MEAEKGSELDRAISRMDAPSVLALATAKGDAGALHAVRTIWASDALVEKRPSKKAVKREEFLKHVAAGLEAAHPEAAAKLLELVEVLSLIENGFAAILARGKSVSGAALPAMTQVSSALHFASTAQVRLEVLALEQMPEGPDFRVTENILTDGHATNPNTEMFGVLRATIATIMMMAYENGWFNDIGQVVLPEKVTQPSDEEAQAIHKVLEYANVWHAWDRAQLRLRLGLRAIKYLARPFPNKTPEFVETILKVQPDDDSEQADFIANERLATRTKQHYLELLRTEERPSRYPSLQDSVKLPPSAFISFDEKLGIITMDQCVSFNVTKDLKSYAGLRIVEWLRGYAVLKRIADEKIFGAAVHHEYPQFSEDRLMSQLNRAGLPMDRARQFMQHASLTKSRNDPYDRPLIRISGDRYVLVWPALKPALLGPIVLSAISDAGAQIGLKGKEFEKTIRKVVKGPGREVGFFTAKRAGEEYDYDALLVWGDFCFLFECKNRSLSGGILQYVYRSNDESKGHARQVHRLVHGLKMHPDMLSSYFPAARGKLLVPCVISALPYSVPGGVDGVLFGDFSMLTRFFESPIIGEVGYRLGMAPERQTDGEIFRLWAGEEPTPLDLLRHLRCSFQYALTRGRTVLRPIMTGVFSESEVLLHAEYGSVDMTVESGRSAAATYDELMPPWSQEDCESRLARIP